jgi:hypothetical protein
MLASTLAAPCRFTAPRSGHTYDFASLVRPPGQDYAMPDAGQPDMRFQYHYNFCGGVVSRPSGGNQDLGVQVSLTVHHMHHTTFCLHSSHQHNHVPSPKHLRVHSLSTTCATRTCNTHAILCPHVSPSTTMRHLPSIFVFTRCPPHAPHAHATHTPFYAHTSYHQHNNVPYRKHLPASRPARASRRRG